MCCARFHGECYCFSLRTTSTRNEKHMVSFYLWGRSIGGKTLIHPLLFRSFLTLAICFLSKFLWLFPLVFPRLNRNPTHILALSFSVSSWLALLSAHFALCPTEDVLRVVSFALAGQNIAELLQFELI